jgi:hypothetical protein
MESKHSLGRPHVGRPTYHTKHLVVRAEKLLGLKCKSIETWRDGRGHVWLGDPNTIFSSIFINLML